ncbi:MAG: prepilin-type N-terminal cleavage/methylation domain-containing protein [Candidatus Omnitrophota bacterium]
MIKKKPGFILLEVLVSLVILTAGILVLIRSLSNIVKSNTIIQTNTVAVLLVDNLFTRIDSDEKIDDENSMEILGKQFFWQQQTTTIKDDLKKMMLTVSTGENSRGIKTIFSSTFIDTEDQ